jgi:hypothetical protein
MAEGRPAHRPKGALGKRTLTLRGRIDQIVPDDQLIKVMWKMALSGDSRCLTYLADRKWGRMVQPVSGTDDGPAISVRVISDDRLGVKL